MAKSNNGGMVTLSIVWVRLDMDESNKSPKGVDRRKVLALGAVGLAGIGTGVSFASSSGSSSLSVSTSASDGANVISSDSVGTGSEFNNGVSTDTSDSASTVSNSDLVYGTTSSTSPSWSVAADTGGGVDSPGDIYILEQLVTSSDLFVELFYNNVGDLSDNYNYLNLDVELHDDQDSSTTPVQTETITLSTGRVSFTVSPSSTGSQGDFHNLAIQDGSWYTKSSISSDTSKLSSNFYLNVTKV